MTPSDGWKRLLLVAVLAASPAVAAGVVEAAAQHDARAQVYDGRFVEPHPDLKLQAVGEAKSKALALYFKGSSQTRSGDFEGGVATFREVLELDPSNLSLASRTASLLARLGEFAEATEVLEESLARNVDEPGPYLNLSEHCGTFHNNDESIKSMALHYARQAVDRFPALAAPYRQLINLHLDAADREKASAVLEEALAQEGDDPYFFLTLGRLAQKVWPYRFGDDDVRKQNLDRVTAIYERALSHAGESKPVMESVADFCRSTRQFGRAVELYRAVIAEHPDDLDAREKLARVFRIQEMHADAFAAFEELVRINPFDARIREIVSEYYAEQGDPSMAAGHLLEAIRLGENHFQNYSNAISLLLESNKLGEAVSLIQRAEFMHPENPFFPRQRGRILRFQEDYDGALAAYQKAEKLALDLLSKEQMDEFLNSEFFFQYGIAAERLQDFNLAADMFRKSIDKIDSDDPEESAKKYNYLGYMWLEQESNIDEAGELIRYANELVPDSGAYADSLGWYYFLKGDFQKAVDELLRAETLLENEFNNEFLELVSQGVMKLEDRPANGGSDPVVLDHIAQAYFKLGNLTEALRFSGRAAALDGATEDIKERFQKFRREPGAPGREGREGDKDTPADR